MPANKRVLTSLAVRRTRPGDKPLLIWDEKVPGLALQVRPTGSRAFKFVYSLRNRVRWFHLGDAKAWDLEAARKEARRLRVKVDQGQDPQGEKRAQARAGTFAQLVDDYFEQYAKKQNRSWPQTRYLVDKHLIPRWGTEAPAKITRSHVKALMREIEAKVVANQTYAAASAIFNWAIREEVSGVTVNPCQGIERHETKSRARVLSASELPRFWQAFENAGPAGKVLQLILMLGQRPGEVTHLRAEHIVDGWWEMPGAPLPSLGWPGTKNGYDHRVWIPAPAQTLLGELEPSGFVLAAHHERPVERLDQTMRTICRELGVTEKVTPHDLRRSHGTTITALGFGREAMNRIQNHREGGIADVYDRHEYGEKNKRIMEAVAAHLLALAESRSSMRSALRPVRPTPNSRSSWGGKAACPTR
jgi:integrase